MKTTTHSKIRLFATTLIFSTIFSGITVMAAPVEVSTVLGSVKSAAQDIYDGSVVARMAGRSGAATKTGAKGIAFEVVYVDKKNLENIFRNELKTIQTKNPTATQVDLVTMTKDGSSVVERLQLKDIQSETGMSQLIKRVAEGDYRQAKLVGTTETAELYNDAASAKGVAKAMIDSNISTETTQRIADKAVATAPKAASMVKNIASSGACYAAFGSIISLGESIVEEKDLSDTVAHTTVGGAKGFVVGSAAGAAGTAATYGLAAAGITTPAAIIIVPVTATISASVLTDIALKDIAIKAEEAMSGPLHTAQDFAEDRIEVISVAIEEACIPEKVENMASAVKDGAKNAAVATTTAIGIAGKGVSNGISGVKAKITK